MRKKQEDTEGDVDSGFYNITRRGPPDFLKHPRTYVTVRKSLTMHPNQLVSDVRMLHFSHLPRLFKLMAPLSICLILTSEGTEDGLVVCALFLR